MPRLAMCHVCRTLTRLPDPPEKAPLVPARIAWMEDGREVEFTYRDEQGFPVMVAQYDPALEDWVTRHEHADIPDHLKKHEVYGTDQETWNAVDVVAQAKKELQGTMGAMYAERDELKDDALACFNQHGRPGLDGSCSDCFTPEKLIGNHESNKRIPMDRRMYLCHACPFVHGTVIPEIRRRKGYYR